jgi:hypothetical protein
MNALPPAVISCGQQPPPPVQNGNNHTILNFSLTIPELMCVDFFREPVLLTLQKKVGLIYLGTSPGMQASFDERVKGIASKSNFSKEELSLQTLVASIWQKTKTWNENILAQQNVEKDIQSEKTMQSQADSAMLSFSSAGNFGKIFTARQAIMLLYSFDSMTKNIPKK